MKLSNLQLLCKSCHHDKTKNEQEDGTYVRIVDSESSFNNNVKEVIDSKLNKHYAFIERMKEELIYYKLTKKKQKIQMMK